MKGSLVAPFSLSLAPPLEKMIEINGQRRRRMQTEREEEEEEEKEEEDAISWECVLCV